MHLSLPYINNTFQLCRSKILGFFDQLLKKALNLHANFPGFHEDLGKVPSASVDINSTDITNGSTLSAIWRLAALRFKEEDSIMETTLSVYSECSS